MSTTAANYHADLVAVLRGGERSGSLGRLVILAMLAAVGYGAVMGSFGTLYGGPGWQIVFAAVKSPMLLAVAFTLTLPSFVVLNLLLGLGRDLPDVLHAVLSAQVAVAVVLLSLSPLTLLWYLSVPKYDVAILFNGLAFAVASLAAQRSLRARYRPLIARDPLHGRLLRVWLMTYAFVGIQAGWVMRPFIGRPDAPAEFLRPEKWDNAYVIVARLAWRTLFH